MNKKLLSFLILLIPITIISFFFKETNFIIKETKQSVEKKTINVKRNEETIFLELEEYIIGVVAGEMPALFEEEALKAQAIASRTYTINHFQSQSTITDTIDDQVYLSKEDMQQKWTSNYEKYYEKIKKAVMDTEGLIMYYDNEPIKAYYYAMSNGYTESSLNVFNEEKEYLKIIESPFDENNEYVVHLSKDAFCQKLNIKCQEIKITDIKKDESNRIAEITINNKTYSGIEVRKKLSLRSTDFSITYKENDIEITTRGYGHGVGMSQYGANNMAKEGHTYEEILKYYYQNIEINSI